MKILTQEGKFQEVDEIEYFQWQESSWESGWFYEGGVETNTLKSPGAEWVTLGMVTVTHGTLICYWDAQRDTYLLGVDVTNSKKDTMRCLALKDAVVALVAFDIAAQAGEVFSKPDHLTIN